MQHYKVNSPSFIPMLRSKIVLSGFFLDKDINRLLYLPLSLQASNQLTELQDFLQEGLWDSNENDCWVYNWGSNRFTSKKAYAFLLRFSGCLTPFSLALVL